MAQYGHFWDPNGLLFVIGMRSENPRLPVRPMSRDWQVFSNLPKKHQGEFEYELTGYQLKDELYPFKKLLFL